MPDKKTQPAKKDDGKAALSKSGPINPSAGKTIDERMADLLADHKRMGAR